MTLFKLLAASVLATAVVATPAFADNAYGVDGQPVYTQGTDQVPPMQLPNFSGVIQKTQGAVVNIRVRGQRPVAQDPFGGIFGSGDLFEGFPGFSFPKPRASKPNGQGGALVDLGEGSGFIISPDGYIVTANHVIKNAQELVVTLNGGQQYKATIVGSDDRTDVALLKINGQNFPFVTIGDSSVLQKGQWVIAIGSPFGLDSTATAGIISAINRDTGEYLPFIQTDVAINPGNSGGPLINMASEVVGMNTQIVSPNGGFAGISLSIPIDKVMRVVQQLKQTGRVVRGYLGVRLAELTSEAAKALNLPGRGGALVADVVPGSPASEGGIQSGDVILSVNGEPINHASDLPRAIGFMAPGSQATIRVWRLGRTMRLTIMLGKAETPQVKAQPGQNPNVPTYQDKNLGASFVNMQADELKNLGITHGIRVVSVGDAGEAVGLREGDVLVAFNKTAINSIKDLKAAEKGLPKGEDVPIQVRRGRLTLWLVVITR